MCLTRSWHVRCTHTSMTKITTPSENCSTWHTLSPKHILHSTVNVGSTNTFCRQKLDYCALSLFGGIHGTIVNCYLASVSVNNTLPLSSVYQIYPDIYCHLPEKSQSSTAGNNGAPTSVPPSLGNALYIPAFGPPCMSTLVNSLLQLLWKELQSLKSSEPTALNSGNRQFTFRLALAQLKKG